MIQWWKPSGLCKTSQASKLQVISTATKDRRYYEQLEGLRNNKPFLQEVFERRTKLASECSTVDIEQEYYERYIIRAQGWIQALIWVTDVLPYLGEDQKHRKAGKE